MDKKTIEFYNKNAHRYAEWRSKESTDLSQRIFLNEVKLNGKIIDLGCGTGEKAIWFNKKGLNKGLISRRPCLKKVQFDPLWL